MLRNLKKSYKISSRKLKIENRFLYLCKLKVKVTTPELSPSYNTLNYFINLSYSKEECLLKLFI